MKKLLFFHEDADEGGCYPVDKFLGAKISAVRKIRMAFERMDGAAAAETVDLSCIKDENGVALKRAMQLLANAMGPTGPKASVTTVVADKVNTNYIGDVFENVNTV